MIPTLQEMLSRAENDPRITSNPQAQEILSVVRSGDMSRIKTLAENLCNTYGKTPQQAMMDTMRFFGSG